jgi:hypothetical protein
MPAQTTATLGADAAQTSGKGLRIALWVVQGLLAVAFGMAGVMKLLTPIAELGANMGWVNSLPEGLVRFIGASELAGAIGLILPAVTRVKPGLTALAGCGLTLVMLLAAAFHLSRSEWTALPPNLLLGGLAAFVAWGRFRRAPISPRV